MQEDKGLLSLLIEKLREEFKGLIRYEVLRGLEKPEANHWQWVPEEINSLSEFFKCKISNTIYPKEQITVLDYLKKPGLLVSKFKFLKENARFYFPNDAFLTQDWLNEIIDESKQVLPLSKIIHDDELFNELKALSKSFFARDSIQPYLPSSFSQKFHDVEYVTNIFIALDTNYAKNLSLQFKSFKNIMSFRLPMFDLNCKFIPPALVSTEYLWESLTPAITMLNELKLKESQMKEIELQEIESQKGIKVIEAKNYNEDMFDQILEVSN
ncbi:hypothetical protein SteCoe_30504 [Stentor coeruleus]|uniref:Uncharacterized protein n=1 Tax=Stentor coeruleus TaxID=5963 RepID=A0A1R2B3K4_9CILI|nr:hypothetical protein SteCoe_30504 [Stentor coeruleus]